MNPDKNWTLFLDRDGVINIEQQNSYVLDPAAFVFYDGALEAIANFTKIFKRIVIVTNQKCIGKGLITHQGLAKIHNYMNAQIEQAGGKIDAIFYSPYLEDTHPCRKPNCGMAYEAKIKFPNEINFEKSIMIGNNVSDMKFAKAVNMKTIFLTTTKPLPKLTNELELIDIYFENLAAVKF